MLLYILGNSSEQGLVFAFMALGVVLSFRMLGFPDLTVEGSFPFGAAITARLIVGHVDPILATLAGSLGGALAGAATGFMHTKLKLNNILAGILTSSALYTLMLRTMGRPNTPLLNYNTVFEEILAWFSLQKNVISLTLVILVLVIVTVVLMGWVLHTDFGLTIRATGNNERMIRNLGVNTDFTKIITLAISNSLVALSGSLVAQDQGFADANMGIGTLVAAVASIIIGETIFGERGVNWQLVSVATGSILYRLLLTVALRLGLPPTDLKLITAVLVLLVLSAPSLRERFPSKVKIDGRGASN